MIISLAQTQPKSGDIAYNLATQETFIRQAATLKSEMIIFPELSITGYEPTMADELATSEEDDRFHFFQELADQLHITIITSAPLRSSEGITISLLIYLPGMPVQTYSKQYLHADERQFFVPEKQSYSLNVDPKIGLAICYELSITTHFRSYLESGIDIYLASAAKTAKGSSEAHDRLATLASNHQIMSLFVNCVGPCDGVLCNGRSAAWDDRGRKIDELSSDSEGLLVIDTLKQSLKQTE